MVIDFICSLCKIFTKFKFLKVLSHAFFYILYGPCIYVEVCVTSHISFCAWFEVGVEVNFFFPTWISNQPSTVCKKIFWGAWLIIN